MVAVGRMLIGDVGVGGGALVEEIARQRPGERLRPRSAKRCWFSWSPLERSVHEVVAD